MFLNKSVLLATITSVPAGMELIPASAGTRTESLNPVGTEFLYISNYNDNKRNRDFLMARIVIFWF